MKKLVIATGFALCLAVFSSTAAFANIYSVNAENGKLLPPAGLGFEINTGFAPGNLSSPQIDAELGYGISPLVTITGEFHKDDLTREKLFKAYYSPMRRNSGYTLYLGYDPDQNDFPLYGLSLWMNNKLLFAFVNLGYERTAGQITNPLLISPGLSVRFGKLRFGAEAELLPEGFACERIGVNASYSLVNKVNARLGIESTPGWQSRIYKTGLVLEM